MNRNDKTHEPKFMSIQRVFMRNVRAPEKHPTPKGIRQQRMAIYQEIMFNNIDNSLSAGFPVLKSILSEVQWGNLARDFFEHHRSTTPYFYEIPKSFCEFLANERDHEDDPIFLYELAHYEWMELALQLSALEIPEENIDRQGDLMQKTPVLSPLAWLVQYHFPVHKIGQDFQPNQTDQELTHIMVYRDRKDKVGFMVCNPLTLKLLCLMQEKKFTGEALLDLIAEELAIDDIDSFYDSGNTLLNELRAVDIVLGTWIGGNHEKFPS